MTDLSAHEKALSIRCPACGVKEGVWCGPTVIHNPYRPITPWMHERRYRKSQEMIPA